MKRLTFGSLFSGIGGFDLGLERAGMECMWQVEIDPYARDILAQHWPDVLRYADVRDFPPNNNPEDYVCDLICGGFPCQDNSKARYGGLGLDGPKSGLWAEFARVLRLLRPRYAIVENVPTLRRRGLDRVLGDLADLGYDAEWSCCPATAVGCATRPQSPLHCGPPSLRGTGRALVIGASLARSWVAARTQRGPSG